MNKFAGQSTRSRSIHRDRITRRRRGCCNPICDFFFFYVVAVLNAIILLFVRGGLSRDDITCPHSLVDQRRQAVWIVECSLPCLYISVGLSFKNQTHKTNSLNFVCSTHFHSLTHSSVAQLLASCTSWSLINPSSLSLPSRSLRI